MHEGNDDSSSRVNYYRQKLRLGHTINNMLRPGEVIGYNSRQPDQVYLQFINSSSQQSFFGRFRNDYKFNPVWFMPTCAQNQIVQEHYPRNHVVKVDQHKFAIINHYYSTLSIVSPWSLPFEVPFPFFNKMCWNSQIFYFQKTRLLAIFQNLDLLSAKITYCSAEDLQVVHSFTVEKAENGIACLQMDCHSALAPVSMNRQSNYQIEIVKYGLQLEGDLLVPKKWKITAKNNHELIKGRLLEAIKFETMNLKSLKQEDRFVRNKLKEKPQFMWMLIGQLGPHEYLIEISLEVRFDRFEASFLMIIDTSQGKRNASFKELQNNSNYQLFSFPGGQFGFKLGLLDSHWIVYLRNRRTVQKNHWAGQDQKEVEKQLRSAYVDRRLYLFQGNTVSQENSYYDRGEFGVDLMDWSTRVEEGYLQCLMHLNEDFDDDLLYDAIQLLLE